MAEVQVQGPEMAVNTVFLTSKRGLLKIAQLVTLFITFLCFCVAFRPKYIVAAGLEILITLFLLLLYGLKLNQMLTFFMWPLVDVFNSIFAATYLIILFLMAVSLNSGIGALVGGITGLTSGILLCVDGSLLFKNITFNRLRGATQQDPTTTAPPAAAVAAPPAAPPPPPAAVPLAAAPPPAAPEAAEQPQQINTVNSE